MGEDSGVETEEASAEETEEDSWAWALQVVMEEALAAETVAVLAVETAVLAEEPLTAETVADMVMDSRTEDSEGETVPVDSAVEMEVALVVDPAVDLAEVATEEVLVVEMVMDSRAEDSEGETVAADSAVEMEEALLVDPVADSEEVLVVEMVDFVVAMVADAATSVVVAAASCSNQFVSCNSRCKWSNNPWCSVSNKLGTDMVAAAANPRDSVVARWGEGKWDALAGTRRIHIAKGVLPDDTAHTCSSHPMSY